MAADPVRKEETEGVTSPLDYVVDIVGMSKTFARRTRVAGYTTIKSSLLNIFRKRGVTVDEEGHTVTHAIKDLTLRIPRGASVGLIGRNGSGKSTFLKLVTGIYKPDVGSLSVKGRVSALIELGAGFHPDFTGRENLFLAGVMHGLSRSEIEKRFDEIVSFAELEAVIDDPVRTYSSGMFMRLGFSIAIHTEPDILLVDEVLAVGDAGFVAKCKDRIAKLRKEGRTLVLVTHDLDAVERWCDEVIWLHAGEVRDRGYPRRVIDAYRSFIERGEEADIFAEESEHTGSQTNENAESAAGDVETEVSPGPARWGSREIEISRVEVLGADGSPKRVYRPEDALTVRLDYHVHVEQKDVVVGVGINRVDGLVVFGTNTDIERVKLQNVQRSGTVEFAVGRLGLLEGSYSIDVAVHRQDGYPFDYHKGVINFTVRSERREVGVICPPREWRHNGTLCEVSDQKREVE